MTFDWSEFYRFAEYLQKDSSFDCQEAVQRTIVSRAYYAAFCMAKETAERKYKIPFKGNGTDHRRICVEYAKRERRDISDALRELRKFRNMCDYQKDIKNMHNLTESSLRLSHEIMLHL